MEKAMKVIRALKLAVGALIVTTWINAWSQPGESGSAPASTVMASPGSSASASSRQADRALGRKVRAALMKDKEISASNISVRARGGAVTLFGTVPDAAQIDRAAGVAEAVPGVTTVKNNLTLKRVFGQ
ncbi:hyperosmotically inducible protein [Paraburkholderia sp. RAU6.4a]